MDRQESMAIKWFKGHNEFDRSVPAIRSFLKWSDGVIDIEHLIKFFGYSDFEADRLKRDWVRIMNKKGVKIHPYRVKYEEV